MKDSLQKTEIKNQVMCHLCLHTNSKFLTPDKLLVSLPVLTVQMKIVKNNIVVIMQCNTFLAENTIENIIKQQLCKYNRRNEVNEHGKQ